MLRHLIIICFTALAACATGALDLDPAAEGARYYTSFAERLSAAGDEQPHVLRLNPVACGCPAFEVQLEGTWYRAAVEIEADSAEVATLRAALGDVGAPGALRTWRVVGTLDAAPASCAQGALYATLRAVGLAPAEGG